MKRIIKLILTVFIVLAAAFCMQAAADFDGYSNPFFEFTEAQNPEPQPAQESKTETTQEVADVTPSTNKEDCKHVYGKPTWEWEKDNSKATACFTCTKCNYRVEYQVDAERIVKKATNKEDGEISFKATVLHNEKKHTCTSPYKETIRRIDEASLQLAQTKTSYTGQKITPDVSVKDCNGNPIAKEYYSIKYKNNIEIGKTAEAVITFKGLYKFNKTLNFEIVKGSINIISKPDFKGKKMTLSWDALKNSKLKYTVTVQNPDKKQAKPYYESKKIKKHSIPIDLSEYPAICGKNCLVIVKAFDSSGSDPVAEGSNTITVNHDWNPKGADCLRCGTKDTFSYYKKAELVPALYKQGDTFVSDLVFTLVYKNHTVQITVDKKETQTAFGLSKLKEAGTYSIKLNNYVDKDKKPLIIYYTVLGTPEKPKVEKITTNQVTLSWNKVEGADGYYVYHNSSKKNVGPDLKTTIQELNPATTYKFYVVAYKNVKGQETPFESAKSKARTVTTKLAAPTNVKVIERTSNSITIGWNKADGASQYAIYQFDFASKKFHILAKTDKQTYKIEKLKAGTDYKFMIKAMKGNVKSKGVIIK